METSRRLARNILWLALEPGIRLLIAIPLAGFVAHRLGVTAYGEFNFALSFAVLFGPLANLGFTEVLLRAVARAPLDVSAVWSSVMAVKAALFSAYLVAVFALALAFGHGARLAWLILIMGLYQGLLSVDNGARTVLAGRQEMKTIGKLGTARTVAEVALTVIVLLLGAKAAGLAVSRAAVAAAGLGATLALTIRAPGLEIVRPRLVVARPFLAPALGFAVIAALRALNERAGVLVLEGTSGMEAVALFSAAMAPVERVFLFLPAMEAVLFPFFSSIQPEQEEQLRSSLSRAVRYQCLLGGCLGLGLSLLGPWLLRLIFPPEFASAGRALEVLGLAVGFRALSHLLSTALAARGGERPLARITALQCGLNVALALALCPRHGAIGLAWAVAASEALALALFVGVLLKRGSLAMQDTKPFLLPALAALALFAVFRAVAGADSLVLPVVFAIAYPALLLAAGVLSSDDRAYLTGLLSRDLRP